MKQTQSETSNTTNQATFLDIVTKQHQETKRPKPTKTSKVRKEETSETVDPYRVIGDASVLMKKIVDRATRIAYAVGYPRPDLMSILAGRSPLTKAVLHCSPELHDLIDMYLEVRELRAKIMGEHKIEGFPQFGAN